MLWLHTTYILIQAYRDLISRLERLPPAPSNSNGGNKGRRGGGGGGGGNAELKKALTKFRQVLASEETFYRSLVARLVRFYNLGEVSGVEATLKTIKLPTEYTTTESGEDESSHAAQFASLQEKKDKILLLYKGLICLGDLERYKEQYKQPANNNRHAQERERQADKFEVAENYYLAAWSLMPDDGLLLFLSLLGLHKLTTIQRCGMEPARSHLNIHPQRLFYHILLLSCSRSQECFSRRRWNLAEILR